MARVLNVAEEERVITGVIGAVDAGDEMRERAFDQWRIADDLKGWLRDTLFGASGKAVRHFGLVFAEDAYSVAVAFVEQVAHLRAAVD